MDVESGGQGMWRKFLNKKLKIIFDDGGFHPSKKEGILLEVTDSHLLLKINGLKEGVAISKIIRWEVRE